MDKPLEVEVECYSVILQPRVIHNGDRKDDRFKVELGAWSGVKVTLTTDRDTPFVAGERYRLALSPVSSRQS